MDVRFRVLAVSAVALAFAGQGLFAAPASGCTPLWTADGEALMADEWASSSSVPVASSPPNPDASRIHQSTFRAQGTKSYRFELRHGDDSHGARVELAQAMPARAGFADRKFYAGQERWISMQYYLPAAWPMDSAWMTVLQIKPSTPGGGGPNIGIDVGFNQLRFYGNSNAWGSAAGNFHDGNGPLANGSHALTKGKWIKLTAHITFSADPAKGGLEIFGDLADGHGMRTLARWRNRATMKYLNGAMDPSHLRVGIYRRPTITTSGVLYIDGLTVATTREAAENNAYRPAA